MNAKSSAGLMTRTEPGALLNRGEPAQTTAQPETPTTDVRAAPAQPAANRSATNAEIRALATSFDLGSDWANGLIDRGATEGEARAAALETLRTRQTPTVTAPRIQVVADHDNPALFTTGAGEAIFARSNARHQLSEPARAYAHMTTLDMAREALRRAGVVTTGLAPADTITRALHTTSDFPNIFGDASNRALRAGYEVAPATLKQVARQTTAKDFRAKNAIQLSEAPTLEKVLEKGEYKYGTFAEAKESYAIDTFGKIFGISRKALVNDDLGAFLDVSGKFGQAAAEFEAQFLVDLLTKASLVGPTMDDGNALFHTSHGNIVTGATGTIDVTKLSNLRLKMRRQKGLGGKPISVAPKYLIVPPERESEGEALLTAVQATTVADVNPFGGKLQLLVEPRLTSAVAWYLAADPVITEGLEYAYLQGNEGPYVETRAGFEVDGVETKVRLDFGAAFLDWRGWAINTGA